MEHTDLKVLQRITNYLLAVDPDLTFTKFQILLNIAQGQDITVREIAAKTSLNLSTITRTVAQLGTQPQRGTKQGLGLVEPTVDPADARRVMLNLTPKGRKMFTDVADLSA